MGALPLRKRLPLDPEVLAAELAELGDLTEMQTEVLRLTIMGEPHKRIGKRLGRSWQAAKFHRMKAFERLGIHDVGEMWALLFEYAGFTLEPVE